MGYYINNLGGEGVSPHDWTLPRFGKVKALLTIPGARLLPVEPVEWEPDLVCVVRGEFEAAAYVFDQDELHRFRPRIDDDRPRNWLIVPGAADLSGYNKAHARS